MCLYFNFIFYCVFYIFIYKKRRTLRYSRSANTYYFLVLLRYFTKYCNWSELQHGASCNICSESQRILVRCTDVRQQSRFDSREKHIRVDEKEKSFKKDLRKRDLEKGITKVEKKNKKWRRTIR